LLIDLRHEHLSEDQLKLPTYGLLTEHDAETIGSALEDVIKRFPHPNIVEIGVRDGTTARGIDQLLRPRPFTYIGVDSARDLGELKQPFPGARIVIGDSAEVYEQVPESLHFVLVDGCHCVNHIILDFIRYGQRLVKGGLMAIHDAAPGMQGKDYQGHGPQTPDFHVATTRALDILNPLNTGMWSLHSQSQFIDWGGTIIYRKNAVPLR
jgi:hypothetical protein